MSSPDEIERKRQKSQDTDLTSLNSTSTVQQFHSHSSTNSSQFSSANDMSNSGSYSGSIRLTTTNTERPSKERKTPVSNGHSNSGLQPGVSAHSIGLNGSNSTRLMPDRMSNGNGVGLLESDSISGVGRIKGPSSANSSSDLSLYSYPEMRFAEEWVKLNVGGTVLISTRTTLSKYSQENNHFLNALINNHAEMNSFKDETGAYLIDRSPTFFKFVIDFLRTGRLDLPNSEMLEGVLAEAEFCNLQALIKLCLMKIEKRDLEKDKQLTVNGQTHGHKKVVYRVIQCSHFELTQMISTLSESWRLEQIIRHSENDGSGSHNPAVTEYMLVVSQDQERGHGEEVRNNNYDIEKVKALSGSMSSQTIRNSFR